MSQVLVTETYLEDIGDAIRDSSGTNTTYTVQEMSTAIRQIARSSSGTGREIGGYIRVTKNAIQNMSTERVPMTWQNVEINTTNGILTLDGDNKITLNSGSYTVLVTAKYQNWHDGNNYIYVTKVVDDISTDIDNNNSTESVVEITSIMNLNAGESVKIDAFCDCDADSYIGSGAAWTNLKVMIMNATDNTSELLNTIYPIGAIYISVNETDPGTLFGGTWEQVKDRFLLSTGDTYSNGETGGEASHTLTVDEMPNHKHDGLYVDASWGVGERKDGYGSGSSHTGVFTQNGTTETGMRIRTGYTGGGKAHNNLPPYLVVYMWKRIS